MMRKPKSLFIVLLVLSGSVLAAALAGCGPCFPPATAPAPTAGPCEVAGSQKVTQALPTGDKNCCSIVYIEKTGPKQIVGSGNFQYAINVTNTSKLQLKEVKVIEHMTGFKLVSSSPKAAVSGNTATIPLGTLAPKETKTVKITGSAAAKDILACTEVSYIPPRLCLLMSAVQPKLQVTKVGPKNALLCDPITYKIAVKNTGTGTACNVVVTDALPAGLKTTDGKTVVTKNLGNLGPNQSREFTIQTKASKVGTYKNEATVKADGGLTARSSAVTVVTAPSLAITKTGPAKRFVGRPVTYTITVTNNGATVAKDTVIEDAIPRGTRFVKASDGGRLSGGKVKWNVGTLQPKAKKTVTVTLTAGAKGVITNTATAKAYCAPTVSAKAATTVEGISAILLECVDLNDPIEVGASVTYRITVTNQGSDIGTGIKVVCTLPAEQQYASSTGPTKADVKGQVVTFAALKKLAPKARAVYKITVKGIKAGDVRFKVSLTSDQMKTPAGETESTHIYQ